VDVRDVARLALAGVQEDVVRLSRELHAEPEVAWQEHASSARVAAVLRAHGFAVEHPAHGLPTALRAVAGRGALRIGFCAEYDALPDVGHACGHNLIAATSVAAAVAVAAVADPLDVTVEVLGTPAEESGGGKVELLDRGAFDGWHAALMAHPAPLDLVAPPVLGAAGLQVRYEGVAAAAAAAPEDGVNAADAVVVAQVALGLLRQQLPADHKVSGVVDEAGTAVNVIPSRATARYLLRTPSAEALPELRRRVAACFEAGAVATGATLELLHDDRPYAPVRHDADLAAMYEANLRALGRVPADGSAAARRIAFSTDMGNVSQRVPAIHPMVAVEAGGAVNHSAAFAAACTGPSAERAIRDGALALAWTAIDAARDAAMRDRLLGHRVGAPA
jgi:amidohydrolase